MISTQAVPDTLPGTLVPFDGHSRARFDGRAGAAPGVRVFVADGQALVRAGFRALLEAGGRISVVGEASTGEEAVALPLSLRPDVVLIDARAAGAGLRRGGRMLTDSGVAVMLLTVDELDDRILATRRAGARGLLLKDSDPAELVRAIQLFARGDAPLSPSITRRLIAERLGISPATAKTHVSRTMLTLGVHDRAQLVVFAFHAGLAVPRAEVPAPHALVLGRAS